MQLLKWLSPAPFLALACLVLALAGSDLGEDNADSRYAALAAITYEGRLEIGSFREWTKDWALSPNGLYYSNKAPFPTFAALPLYYVIEKARGGPPAPPPLWERALLCFFVQMLPFLVACLLSLRWLEARGVSSRGVLLSALALLFGNTAALFAGVFFGHALAAALVLLGFLAMSSGRWVLSGFVFSLALASDYSVLYLAPGLAFLAWHFAGSSKAFLRALPLLVAGGIPAAILLGLYHYACFGSPFALPLAYLNPALAEGTKEVVAWGSTGLFPHPEIFLKLLFGAERGLLFTQPWVFLLLAGLFGSSRRLVLGGLLCLLGLLWMNASFPSGWQAGWAAGPRYLSASLPLCAVLCGLVWGERGRGFRICGAVLLLPSLLLAALACTQTVLVPSGESLWPWLASAVLAEGLTAWIKLGLFFLALGLALSLELRRARESATL